VGRKRSKGKKDEKQPEQRPEMSFSEYALLMQDSMTRLGLYADLLVEGVAGPGGEATPRGGHPRRVMFEPEVDPTSSGASKLIKHARKLVGFGGGLGRFRVSRFMDLLEGFGEDRVPGLGAYSPFRLRVSANAGLDGALQPGNLRLTRRQFALTIF
jgi:hypothetical protein